MLRGLLYRGRHRGEYRPSPEWRQPGKPGLPPWPQGIKIFGMVTDSDHEPTMEAVVTLTPSEGMGMIPALVPRWTKDIPMPLSTKDMPEEPPLYSRVWKDGEFAGYAYN